MLIEKPAYTEQFYAKRERTQQPEFRDAFPDGYEALHPVEGFKGAFYATPFFTHDVAVKEVQPTPGIDAPFMREDGEPLRINDELLYDGHGYGVVDSVEQFYEKFGKVLEDSPTPYVVTLLVIEKDSSNAGKGGGWRWHKWGPYRGDNSPECEYLDDEGDDITQAVCYEVHEVLEAAK